jgi:hypothetical protein
MLLIPPGAPDHRYNRPGDDCGDEPSEQPT